MAAPSPRQDQDRAGAWLDALMDRHTRGFTTTEYLKAVRALSARYVERRSELPARSPLDSAGKRAAFAAFFAPLHFYTARAVIEQLAVDTRGGRRVLDLGCGTGVTSAAWALHARTPLELTGIDLNSWSVAEAAWNWRTLGLRGQVRRGNLVDAAAPDRGLRNSPGAVVLGWSVNELTAADRARLLPLLLERCRSGASLLILEPLARTAVPWWDDWAVPIVAAGGRADEWKLDRQLPPRLAATDKAAGFRREVLGARSLWLAGAKHAPTIS